MIWWGLGAVIVSAAAAGVWFAPVLSRAFGASPQIEAELPRAFGMRMAWVAVRTRDTARLINVAGLEQVRAMGWSDGLGAVYADRGGLNRVYVTPPVDGWSFIVSLGLPLPMGTAYVDKAGGLIERLSGAFGPVGFFVSYPALDFYGWAWAQDGAIRRGFAVGREGVVWNRGAVTVDERLIASDFFALSEVRRGEAAAAAGGGGAGRLHPFSERDVLSIAKAWSVDPSQLEGRDDLDRGIGYLAQTPDSWQAALSVNAAA